MEDKLSKENAVANNLTYDEWQAGKTKPDADSNVSSNGMGDSFTPREEKKEPKAYDATEIGRAKYPEGYVPCKKANFQADKCKMIRDESCADCRLNLKSKE